MSSTELCGIEALYVDTCWILNAMPSTGPCGIEMFYVDTSGILNAMCPVEGIAFNIQHVST
jgi:hypothetical protein